MRPRLTVIITSRAQADQEKFLARALASIAGQSVAAQFEIHVVIGVDAGCAPRVPSVAGLTVVCAESAGSSQAAALNAALARVSAGFVAFLEDDDQWLPEYLLYAVAAIAHCDFVSSTQLEVGDDGVVLRIHDFPTPSGWFTRGETLARVGAFDEAYRFHLDNEWLGRLAETKARRLHLVESTGPATRGYMTSRPDLARIVDQPGGLCRVARHGSPFPLVRRLVHERSGTGQIVRDGDLRSRSRTELAALRRRFGRIPC